MAQYNNRKKRKTLRDKSQPNYSFLVSYDPKQATVKGESNLNINPSTSKLLASKKAAELAKEDSIQRIKKDIIISLILVSFILIVELVVYLARSRFGIN